MADKKRDILEFVEQSNFEQFTPTLTDYSGTFFQCLVSRHFSDWSMLSMKYFSFSIFQSLQTYPSRNLFNLTLHYPDLT